MLFVAVATGLAIKARLHALQTAHLREAAAYGALADGAALFVVDALREVSKPDKAAPQDPAAAEPIPVNGLPLDCPMPRASSAGGPPASTSARIVLRVVDAGGLVDLNAAPEPMMTAVFGAAGLDAATASTLATEIGTVRTPKDAASGTAVRSGSFLDPSEVRVLRNVAAARRVLPLLTVDNPRPAFDLAVTDRFARTLLPRDAPLLPSLRPYLAPSRGEVFRIEVWFVAADGAVRASRGATAAFQDGRAEMPRIRAWSRLSDVTGPPNEAAGAGTEPGRVTALCTALRDALGPQR
ncbi:hypothetical protein ASG43_06165 [Aureimonas sp. Leaf454]|nr:hypothetical protein ASG43_06165 [Aureimonas sp. Leaf454]